MSSSRVPAPTARRSRSSKEEDRVYLKLHPRLAPVKTPILPLSKKDWVPEVASELYGELKRHMSVQYSEKGAVGRRYRRQDEIGTPFCVTIDGQTLQDGTVTIRDRDTLEQTRVKTDEVLAALKSRIGE